MKETAKYPIGKAVRHKRFGFRGVIFDVDPEFSNSDEWYDSIPAEIRPRKDQPYYHLFAENHDKTPYIAYVSEQNLVPDDPEEPIDHPGIEAYFSGQNDGVFVPRVKPH